MCTNLDVLNAEDKILFLILVLFLAKFCQSYHAKVCLMFHLKQIFGFKLIYVKTWCVRERVSTCESVYLRWQAGHVPLCSRAWDCARTCTFTYMLTLSQTIYHCWRTETHLLSQLVGVNLSTDSRRRLHHTFFVHIGYVCVSEMKKNKEKERGKRWLGGYRKIASEWLFVPHRLQTNYSFLPDLSPQLNYFFSTLAFRLWLIFKNLKDHFFSFTDL